MGTSVEEVAITDAVVEHGTEVTLDGQENVLSVEEFPLVVEAAALLVQSEIGLVICSTGRKRFGINQNFDELEQILGAVIFFFGWSLGLVCCEYSFRP